jgi:hypothetical protein
MAGINPVSGLRTEYVDSSASFSDRITTIENAGGAGTPLSAVPSTSVNNSGSVAGVSLSASHADHAHFHGYLSGGGFHAIATSLSAGFMSTADRTQLFYLTSTLGAFTASYFNTSASFNLRINNLTASYLSVKDFGAVGDGSTDDTVALQRAINAISASGGGLYIPPGTYMFSNLNMTRINSNFAQSFTLAGAGPAVSILYQTVPATGTAIDICASNYLRFKSFGLQCGPNSSIGLLAARYTVEQNCNFNTFDDFWIRGSAATASLMSIAAESTIYTNCWFDGGGPQTVMIAESNYLGVTSSYGTIQQENSNIENHFYGCRFSNYPGRTVVRLTDGNGVEFIACSTYNLTNLSALTSHFLVENPTNLNGASWPTRIQHHLFEGVADTGVLFKAASHGNGATYQHFSIRDSWMSMQGDWVTLDMTDKGASPFGIIHSDFVFENNASPQSQRPGSITLNEVENSIISHYVSGSCITISGSNNYCVIRGYGGASNGVVLANNLCSKLELLAPYADLGKNYEVYGSTLGQAGRYIQIIPAHSAPAAGQISTGMILAASGAYYDPANLGISTPYPAFYDGNRWLPMFNFTGTFVVASSSFASRITSLEGGSAVTFANVNAALAAANATININGQNLTGAARLTVASVGVGLTSSIPRFHMLSEETNTTPTEFTAHDFVIGRAALGDVNSGAVFMRYDLTHQQAFIGALSPGVAWRDLKIGANSVIFQAPNGLTKLTINNADGSLTSGDGSSLISGFSALRANGSQIISIRDSADGGAVKLAWYGRAYIEVPSSNFFEFRDWGTGAVTNIYGSVTSFSASRNEDGNATFPAYSFRQASGSGMYRDGTTLGFCIDGYGRMAYLNQFGVWSCQYIAIGGAAAFMNSGGNSIINFTDVNDVGMAGVHCGYDVQSPGSSDSPTVRVGRRIYTNSGSSGEFAVVLPPSANTGTEFTLYDVGGSGGISFIAPVGESIRVGLAVTSGASRKVKSTDGAGAELTLVKVTTDLWIQKGGFVGTWVGS